MNALNISVIDEYQSYSRTSYPRTDDSVDSHDAHPVVNTQSHYSTDIERQNIRQSGDNCQSVMSHDTVTEMDVVTELHTEPHTEREISPAVQQDNTSKLRGR